MKLAILSVKFIPVFVTIALMFQCVLALFNVYTNECVSTIYGHSILYNFMLLILSKAFHFCMWHRVIILDLILINAIEWIDRNLYSFTAISYIWILILLLLTSSLIASLLYLKYGCFKHTAKK